MKLGHALALNCLLAASCSAAPPQSPSPVPGAGGGTGPSSGLAFPGAVGYGKSASGGRGGEVIHVTNLNASGPGSFQAAVQASGPRVVVFDVAGNIPIQGHLQIRDGDLTIACQSAPGGGVSFVGGTLAFGEFDDETPYESQRNIKTRNLVVRHCRSRDPAASVSRGDNADGIQLLNVDLAIFDHVSIAWAADESGAARRSRRISWQNCLITEPLINGKHSKGAHPYGPIAAYGTYDWSMVGCFLSNGWHRFPHLIGNNLSLDSRPPGRGQRDREGPLRPPRSGGRAGRDRQAQLATNRLQLGPPNPVFLFSGNTVFNVGGPEGIGGSEVAIGAHAVIENNAYWSGPDTLPGWLPIRGHDRPDSAQSGSRISLRGNTLDGVQPSSQRSLVATRFSEVAPPEEESSRWSAPAPDLSVVADLDSVGALPHDEIDARVLREFAARAGSQGAPWRKAGDPVPAPAAGPPLADGDRDGMPDRWERERGRDASIYDPWHDKDCNGWSDLEDYLNERAGDARVAGDCDRAPAAPSPVSSTPEPEPDPRPEPTRRPSPPGVDQPSPGAGLACANVVRFEARCQRSARGAGIQARVMLRGAADGASVTISVDGRNETVTVRDGRAIFEQRGAAAGSHTIRLVDPAGCAADVPVSCSGR